MATTRLRVLTWNLHGAGRPDLGAVAGLLRALSADVVALQEVRRRQAVTLVEALRPAGAAWTFKHDPFGALGRVLGATAEGLALLLPERAPVRSVDLTPGTSRRAARRRVAQVAVLPRAGVRVVNTHLDAHDAGPRLRQARLLAEELARGPAADDVTGEGVGVPIVRSTVLLGDLNAQVTEGGVFERLAEIGLRDAWGPDDGTSPAAFTSPAHAPVQRIDHVLVSPGVEVDAVRVPPGEWARWSDHLPVLADLTVPTPDPRT